MGCLGLSPVGFKKPASPFSPPPPLFEVTELSASEGRLGLRLECQATAWGLRLPGGESQKRLLRGLCFKASSASPPHHFSLGNESGEGEVQGAVTSVIFLGRKTLWTGLGLGFRTLRIGE